MLPFIETISGTAYEMGKQQGQLFKHVIKADVHQCAMRHSFQGSEQYIDDNLLSKYNLNKKFAPWFEDEIQGIADGSGVDVKWLHRLNLRCWEVGNLPFVAESEKVEHTPEGTSECTAIGLITKEDGVVIGGNLDDQRAPYALIRRLPKDGFAHVTVARVGSIWNQNGMNEKGLFMAADGMGKHPEFKDINPEPMPANGTIKRLILQTCKNVPEAIELIKKSRTSHNFVLADAEGNLAAVQVMGSLFDVQYGKDFANMVFCTNHAFMPGIVNPLLAQKCEPYVAEKSRVRFDVLLNARSIKPKNLETLKELLKSHDGHPNCICNNLTAFSVLAKPQKDANGVWASDMSPCSNEYGYFKIKI